MGLTRSGFAGILMGLAATAAFSQSTAVQLPTYSHFAVGTTVSVPDQGGARLGSLGRGRSEGQSFGSPLSAWGNSALDQSQNAPVTGISAVVHDFAAIEQHLLARSTEATARPDAARGESWRGRLRAADASTAGQPAQSVAAIAAELGLADRVANVEAAQWRERGRLAEAEGKRNVAKIYYGMAARRATGAERNELLARITQLQSPAKAESSAKPNDISR